MGGSGGLVGVVLGSEGGRQSDGIVSREVRGGSKMGVRGHKKE